MRVRILVQIGELGFKFFFGYLFERSRRKDSRCRKNFLRTGRHPKPIIADHPDDGADVICMVGRVISFVHSKVPLYNMTAL